ncbi:MAG: DUF2934 domain-containing protein [Terriglobales bacterium]|jgi:hypothetical protein
MIDSKVQKQPQPKIVIGPKSIDPKSTDPKSSIGKVATMSNAVPSEDRIRVRAYELYQSRGREPGQDEQDWLRAEREILKRER